MPSEEILSIRINRISACNTYTRSGFIRANISVPVKCSWHIHYSNGHSIKPRVHRVNLARLWRLTRNAVSFISSLTSYGVRLNGFNPPIRMSVNVTEYKRNCVREEEEAVECVFRSRDGVQ